MKPLNAQSGQESSSPTVEGPEPARQWSQALSAPPAKKSSTRFLVGGLVLAVVMLSLGVGLGVVVGQRTPAPAQRTITESGASTPSTMDWQSTTQPEMTSPGATPYLATPEPSSFRQNFKDLSWKKDSWSTPEDRSEAFIPSVTYSISYPDTWDLEKKVNPQTKCFELLLTDVHSYFGVTIESFCKGWSADDDRIPLPSNYVVVKKTKRNSTISGPYSDLILRTEHLSKDEIPYHGGTTQSNSDSVQTANLTSAVIIRKDIAEGIYDDYFTPVSILAHYGGDEDQKENFLKVVDQVVSSLVMTKIGGRP